MNYDPDQWRFRECDQQVNPLPNSRVALTGSVPAWQCKCHDWNGINMARCNNCGAARPEAAVEGAQQ